MKTLNYFTTCNKRVEPHALNCLVRPFPITPLNSDVPTYGSIGPDYYQLIWIIKGEGSQWIDIEKTEIINDQLICLKPGQVYRCESPQTLYGYVIQVGADFLSSIEREVNSLRFIDLMHLFANGKGIKINDETKAVLEHLVFQLSKILKSNDLLDGELIKCYIAIFILHLNHEWDGLLETRIRTRNIQIVESFIALVERHFKEKRMVSEYASELAVTPNYLNEIVKKITGVSAGHVIRQRVGLEAKRQAVHTGLCMKEIAYSLGFSDQAHFSKFFKSITGRTFSDFKKERITSNILQATL